MRWGRGRCSGTCTSRTRAGSRARRCGPEAWGWPQAAAARARVACALGRAGMPPAGPCEKGGSVCRPSPQEYLQLLRGHRARHGRGRDAGRPAGRGRPPVGAPGGAGGPRFAPFPGFPVFPVPVFSFSAFLRSRFARFPRLAPRALPFRPFSHFRPSRMAKIHGTHKLCPVPALIPFSLGGWCARVSR